MGTGVSRAARARVRKLVRHYGFDVVRHDATRSPELRRLELLRRRRLGVVLDVGANDGPFGRSLRETGYDGRIVSFEPQSDAFARLAAAAGADPLWECRRVALGAAEGEETLYLAANSSSSSLLEMAEQHERSAPDSRYVGTERVSVVRLDSMAGELLGPDERAYLKVDVQGAELDVLRGASGLLDRVDAVESELSLAPLYEGGPLLFDVLAHLEEAGFVLVSLEPVFSDPVTGRLLQLDGIFVRPEG